MGFREDVKCMLSKECNTKVPSEKEILRQAKMQIGIGKSTGNVNLDRIAIQGREDVRCTFRNECKKVPSEEEILRQAKMQIGIGKSTGSVNLDRIAIQAIDGDEGR